MWNSIWLFECFKWSVQLDYLISKASVNSESPFPWFFHLTIRYTFIECLLYVSQELWTALKTHIWTNNLLSVFLPWKLSYFTSFSLLYMPIKYLLCIILFFIYCFTLSSYENAICTFRHYIYMYIFTCICFLWTRL